MGAIDKRIAHQSMTRTIADHKLSSAFSTPPPRRLLRPDPTPISSRSLSPAFFGRHGKDADLDESAGESQSRCTAAHRIDAINPTGPSRPPVRPTGPSKHHLEPNPFEQSFSSKPSDGQSASPDSLSSVKTRRKGANKTGKTDRNVKPEEIGDDNTVKGEEGATRANEPSTPSATAQTAQTPSKRILPPVSSIVSPAPHEAGRLEYPWGSALTGSLRSGPLSPAMLAGPQSAFDVSSFRSGFTPDLSNFKTGLTPLGSASGNGYPPPSPNTAAFLAMVTNSSAPGMSNITPNTLSALSGNPMDAHANGHPLVSSQPGNKMHHHGEHHDQFDFAFGRSMQDTPSKQGSKLRMSTMGTDSDGRDGSADFADSKSGHHERGANNHQQQQQTTQAASGLFLLSQAHQELSKREDAAAAAAAITHPTYNEHAMNGQQLYSSGNGQKTAEGKAAKGANSKRKKSAEPGTAQKATTKKAKAVSNKLEDFTMEDMGYESDEIDDEGNRRTKSSNGEGGDDEDKRKSFLERNRQAALKCRQRKKAWLASLQAKVEYLQSDNENLQGTCSALRNEVMFLKSQLMQAQRQIGGPTSMEGAGTVPAPPIGRTSISGSEHQQNNGTGNRMGATSGQYQAHAVPRPTHIPGQPSAPQYPSHPLQGSAQAA